MTTERSDVCFSNFKCSLRLCPFQGATSLKKICKMFPHTSKLVNNFLVLKEQWVYIIFSSGFVNITKIKNTTDDLAAMQVHLSSIAPESALVGLRLENLTGSFRLLEPAGFFNRLMRLNCLNKSIFRREQVERRRRRLGIQYDFTTFPEIKIFTDVGVALVFSNGKTNIVGCKNKSDARWIENLIQQLIKQHVNQRDL